jgi:prenylated cyclic peptide (anacyclamide/piricyclamide family)
MTKKNIRPQQTAPVQRETLGKNYSTEGKMTAHKLENYKSRNPFAGDDAE